MLTWSENPSLPSTVTNPVIFLATASNMIPFESESLSASGLQNSYVKLDGNAAAAYLSQSYLAKYKLDDNHPRFLAVKDFIAGLQKSLSDTLQLYGAIAFLSILVELVLIAALVKIFAISRREEIAVKRLMGHPLLGIFLPPMLLIITVSSLCVLGALALRSNSAVAIAAVAGILQIVLLLFQARRASRTQVSQMIKAA
jgi:hypothetical protein